MAIAGSGSSTLLNGLRKGFNPDKAVLKWSLKTTTEKGIKKTVARYLENREFLNSLRSPQFFQALPDGP